MAKNKNTEEQAQNVQEPIQEQAEQQVEVAAKVPTKEDQIQDLTNTLKRLQAEFENYKKRTEKENCSLIKNANVNIIRDLLATLDSFELALKHTPTENPDIEKFKKGFEMIYAQFFSALQGYGLRVIDTKNQKFDPYLHEVLMIKETDQQDDVIIEEFQKGYKLNDIVVRHSKVMISKKVEVK